MRSKRDDEEREMSVTESEGVAVLPPEARKQEIPYLVVLWMLNAAVHENYRGEDGVALELDGKFYPMSRVDYETVRGIGTEIAGEYGGHMRSPREWMLVHRIACQKLGVADTDPMLRGRSVVMLKDRGGAGYWRMVLPSKYLGRRLSGAFRIDVTAAEVKFEHLLEYDTVFVQRLHDWESYYVLEKLKKAGKRIVYDMDDDIFSLTPDNPAFHVISRDNQQAAVACMKLADDVTTTTDVLADGLSQVTGRLPEVIPNALDTQDGWNATDQCGSPDGHKRIFWQGSATHDADWEVCIEAVDRAMQRHEELRLVILGYLPKAVQQRVKLPHWKGKVEYVGFSDPETYFDLIKHIRAEVGLAPLTSSNFNRSKSPIKWLEATLIGMPVVASQGHPYSDVIDDGKSGRLVAGSPDEWFEAIEGYLTNADSRRIAIEASRIVANECFDINKVVKEWQEVLLPE